jgi:hypothetical protein
VPLALGHPIGEVGFVFLTVVPLALVYSWISYRSYRGRLIRRVEERPGESICTFVRAIDYRRVDTCIIRAVYEEIAHYLATECPNFPLRPNDGLIRELDIDAEDLEDIAKVIAFRTRRSLASPERNPFHGKVETAEGLVYFFAHQAVSG